MKRIVFFVLFALATLTAGAQALVANADRYKLTLDLTHPADSCAKIDTSAYYVMQNYAKYLSDSDCWVYENDTLLHCVASPDLLTGAAIVKFRLLGTSKSGNYYVNVQTASGRYLPAMKGVPDLDKIVWTETEPVKYLLSNGVYGIRFVYSETSTLLYADDAAPYIKVNASIFSGANAQFRLFKVLEMEERTDCFAQLEADVDKWFTQNVGSYFAMSQDFYDANISTYEAYRTNGCTYEEWQEMKAAVLADVTANVPESGWYRLRSLKDGGCIGYGGQGKGRSNPSRVGTIVSGSLNEKNLSTPIYLEKQGDHVYTLKINNKYLQATTGNYSVRLGDSPVAHTFSNGEMALPGYVCITGEGAHSKYPYAARTTADSVGLLGYKNTAVDTLTYWRVDDALGTEVEVAMIAAGDSTYGTAFAQYPFVPANATAFAVSSLYDDVLLAGCVALGGDGVPAATPVLLIGTDSVARLTVSDTVEAADAETNLLEGTFLDESLAAHVLGLNADTIAFVYAPSTQTLKANTAYISQTAVSSSKQPYALADDEVVSSIDRLPTVSRPTAAIFDLQGRQRSRLQKGVNIVGGKKVIY